MAQPVQSFVIFAAILVIAVMATAQDKPKILII
jgi:hypothetical protein